jgi:hypothetical protein
MQSLNPGNKRVARLARGFAEAHFRVMTSAAHILALFLATAGGETMTNSNPVPPGARAPGLEAPGDDPCGAADLEYLIGAPVPDAAALAALDGPLRVRVVRPGDFVTMDHVPRRLNIETNADGIVRRLRCG